MKSVSVGGALMLSSQTSQFFDPYLYSSVSSSAGWWKATPKSFVLNKGIVTVVMPTTPPEPGWCAVYPTPSRLLSI